MTSDKKQISLFLSLVPIAAMIGLVVIGHLIYNVDLRFILLVSAIIAGFTAYIAGTKVDQMFEAYASNIKRAFPVILILMAIGGIVGTWMYSGTVPYLIYYGLQFLHPNFVLVSAFLVTAMVSTFTGTSWGSAATAGVAFIGIGASMGIPLPMVAGAALSGAVFGDKVSPISDTTNLCSLASDITVYQHIKGMLPNIILAGLAAAIGFTLLGIFYSGSINGGGEVEKIISDLEGLYNFNIFMLIPALVVFVGGYKGFHPVVLMILSSVIAVLIGMLSNGFAATDGANAIFSGFNIEMAGGETNVSESLNVLLNRGGFEGMLTGAVLYAILAIGFGSFMEVCGALNRLMRGLLSFVRSAFGLVVSAFMAGGILNAVSGNAAFSILTTGQLFKQPFKDKNISASVLSRSMENSMTLLESLLPWHVTAIYMTGIFGVATVDYLPFAFFNMAGIVLFFVLAWREVVKRKTTLNQ
jgi:NhaC family Na+:H+ antiporter